MAPNDLTIFRNVGLDDAATSTDTSTVGEPSVAVSGRQAFLTGNWYASRSTNEGQDWSHVDPFTSLPSAAGGFCCDQVVVHDRRREVWIWILQYITANGTNVFRLAASRDNGFPNHSWYWWDISPATLDGRWTNVWFDYPDIALTNDHAWVTFNVFDSNDVWQRAVIMKFPLATIACGRDPGLQLVVDHRCGFAPPHAASGPDNVLGQPSHGSEHPPLCLGRRQRKPQLVGHRGVAVDERQLCLQCSQRRGLVGAHRRPHHRSVDRR